LAFEDIDRLWMDIGPSVMSEQIGRHGVEIGAQRHSAK
jgi:hypothetical protein